MMRGMRSALAVVVALWSVAASAVAAPLRTGAVEGQVVDAADRTHGIAGARVIASDPWAGPVDTVRTDASGRFRFARLAAGRIDLDVRIAGYTTRSQRTVPVLEDSTLSGVTLVVAQSVTLSGRVVGPQGEPLAGVPVSALDAQTRTDAAGRYTLRGVRPEIVRVEAAPAAFMSARSPELSLQPGESRALPDLACRRGRAVTGRVVDGRGAPLAGAEVSCGDRSAKSDARGAFALHGVAPQGDLSLWKTGFGWTSVPLPADTLDVRDLRLTLERQSAGGAGMLSVAMDRDAWMPRESPRVTVWASSTAPVQLRLRREGNPTVRFTATADSRTRNLVQLPAQPAGVYTLDATQGDRRQSLTFCVSDIALLAEQAPGATRVRAVRLADGAPVAGLALSCALSPMLPVDQQPLVRRVTDAQGLIDVPGGVGTVFCPDGAHPAQVRLRGEPDAESGVRVAVLLDRPAVRPGGQLGVKVIARREAAGALEAVRDSLVRIVAHCSDGSEVVREGRCDAAGVYVDSLTLPRTMTEGSVGLDIAVAGTHAGGDVPLTVRPSPPYTVDVTATPRIALPGDTVRVLVSVHRQDGLPASSVPVTLMWDENAASFPWGDDAGWGGWASIGLMRRDRVLTDALGEVAMTQVVPADIAGDMALRITAQAQPQADEPVQGDARVQVLASLRHVAVLAPSPAVRAQPLRASFEVREAVLGTAGRPAMVRVVPRAAVRVDLFELVTTGRVRRAVWREGASLACGDDGRVAWESALRPARNGAEYRLRATAVDAAHRATVNEYSWCTAGAYDGPAPVVFGVKAVADTLRDGAADAVFRVEADAAGTAFVAVAGHQAVQWLPPVAVVAGITEFRVPASMFGAGGVRVAAYTSRLGDVYYGEAASVLRRPGMLLRVEVEPDRTLLAPRDTLRLTVRTRDDAGRGVPAEVALTAYDRALLSFGPDDNPRLAETFWLPRRLPLSVFSGVQRSEAAGGKDDEQFVRHDIRDVAVWLPRLRTGADGVARVALRMPDNLTTWRITAHAVGDGTAVGQTQTDVTARRALALSVSTPEAVVAGDSLVLRATVRAREGEPPHRIAWSLRVRGATAPASLPSLEVTPSQPVTLDIPLRVAREADSLSLTLVARDGAVGDGVVRAWEVATPERLVFADAKSDAAQWDSVTVRAWPSAVLAAALEDGAHVFGALPERGTPERVGAIAARLGIAAAGLPAAMTAPFTPGDTANVVSRERLADALHAAFARAGLPGASGVVPRALRRADGALDLPRASDLLVAVAAAHAGGVTADRDPLRALLAMTADAVRAPRVDAAGSVAASCAGLAALAAVPEGADRRMLDARFAAFDSVSRGFSRDSRLWEDDLAPSYVWYGGLEALWPALVGGTTDGWAPLWADRALATLAPLPASLTARTDWPQAARTPRVATLCACEADSAPALAARLGGDFVRTQFRGHAPLGAALDTTQGALDVQLVRDVPVRDAWGEWTTQAVPVTDALHVGETARLVVRTSRRVAANDMRLFVPLCAGFDTRPALTGGARATGDEHEIDDDSAGGDWVALPGMLDAAAWRATEPGATIFEATLRASHAGRFTWRPLVLHSGIFPSMCISSPARTIEVRP